jgi:hypothetical protein
MSFATSSCNLGPLNISLGPTATPTLTPTPTSTPTPVVVLGIDAPIIIKGADLQFIEVETMKSFNFYDQIITTKAPYNTWIVIKAKIEYSDKHFPCKWTGDDRVTLEYLKGGEKEEKGWTMCQGDKDENWVRFFFPSYTEGVTDYVIILPDGTSISLDKLVK